MQSEQFGQLTFGEAFQLWLRSRTRLSPASVHEYDKNFKRLSPFFGVLRLNEIHIGHIREYVDARRPIAGASRINHEISTVQQMLKRAGLWAPIASWYEPLPLPRSGPGIALEPHEEEHLFRVAATRPRWRVAFYCSLVTNNTTAGPEEIRMLQLRDIDLIGRVLNIRDGVKNKYRMRAIPLNDEAHWALQQLVRRAESKGCIMPDHCLLPARLNPIDPHRPMESWKKAWYALRAEAGKKFPRLAHLRRYDLRHHSLTRLMEDPDSSEATIEDIAGHHFSSKMKRRYSHIRMDAKRAALSKLGAARSSGYAPIMTEGFYPRGRKPQVKAQPVDASGKAV